MRYHNITKDDMLNGDGLRVVLWVAGCEHHCPNCQNPVTWDINGGLEFDEAAKKEIFDELEKNYVSGITFSGGDPLHTQNRKDVGALIEEIKEKFGVDVVRLKRNSVGMSLVQSDIDEVLKKVCLLYEDDDTLIQYQMEIQSENKSYAYDIEDKKVKRTQITVDGNKIDIIQYELDDGNEENVAQFAYEDVFYTINTTMEEADFKELLKNLYFF